MLTLKREEKRKKKKTLTKAATETPKCNIFPVKEWKVSLKPGRI